MRALVGTSFHRLIIRLSDIVEFESFASKIRAFLFAPCSRRFEPRTLFWLAVSLMFAVIIAREALQQAFGSTYVIQDDGRQHVFWMWRFVDSQLFPQDLIADYFQSVAPAGYTLLYRIAARLGADPILFSKLLPMPLGVLTTLFCFGVSMRLLPVPSAAFVSSLVLNESLWMRNGLVSATPRAFISPLFLAFIFFVLSDSAVGVILTIILMALFFPSITFIAVGTLCLRVLRVERWRIGFSREPRDYLLAAAAIAGAVLILFFFAVKTSTFGPVVTAAEAKSMPEFLPRGRMVVFRQGWFNYWITGSHTGMFSSALLSPYTMYLGFLFPLLMFFPKQFPLTRLVSGGASILPRIVAASLAMFFAANALLFRLYLPSRFTVSSFRIILALSAGLAIIIILDAMFDWAANLNLPEALRALLPAAGVAAAVVILLLPRYLNGTWVDTRYKTGRNPELYEYLQQQPKDSVIASLSDEADNLPAFARRPILAARETALPFHKGYYSRIRERASALIHAQYTPKLDELQDFVTKYRVSFLLLDRDAFMASYVADDKWISQYQPAAKEAIELLRGGAQPALEKLRDECSVLSTDRLYLVSAECILKSNGRDFKLTADK